VRRNSGEDLAEESGESFGLRGDLAEQEEEESPCIVLRDDLRDDLAE
jgi:hypothetical protein